jgi:hypothetical protein
MQASWHQKEKQLSETVRPHMTQLYVSRAATPTIIQPVFKIMTL